MRFTIETLRREHLEQILRINETTNASSWNGNHFEAELNNQSSENLGIINIETGDLACFLMTRLITISNTDSQLDLLLIASSLSFQRMGLASLLLKYLLINQTKAVEIILEVRKNNTAAISFYRNFGFSTISERKNYYSNPQENALILLLKYSR